MELPRDETAASVDEDRWVFLADIRPWHSPADKPSIADGVAQLSTSV